MDQDANNTRLERADITSIFQDAETMASNRISSTRFMAERQAEDVDQDGDDAEESTLKKKTKGVHLLGTLMGVYLPCVQNILGVILFLRLPWITAEAGVYLTSVIVLMCVTSTFATSLSLSAMATNGKNHTVIGLLAKPFQGACRE